MKVIAAILAGGSGSRIGGETPKQMLPLGGKPVLEHSIATFDAHPGIEGIVIVSRKDLLPAIRTLTAPYAKVRAVIPGGSDRTASSLAAVRAALSSLAATDNLAAVPASDLAAADNLAAIPASGLAATDNLAAIPALGLAATDNLAADDYVGLAADDKNSAQQIEGLADVCLLIHDAARPLVDAGVITRCLEALSEFSAVEPAVPLSDTIIRIDDDGLLVDVPPRSTLRAVQTPQGFRFPVLAEAFRRHLEDHSGFRVTDDISLVRHYLPGISVKVVDGSPRNLKLTHPTDLPLLEALLSTR